MIWLQSLFIWADDSDIETNDTIKICLLVPPYDYVLMCVQSNLIEKVT